MAKRFLTPIGAPALASDPGTGSEGQIYYNTASDVMRLYKNGAWSDLAGGGGVSIASASPAGTTGGLWYENDTGNFYVYDSNWVKVGGPVSSQAQAYLSSSAPLIGDLGTLWIDPTTMDLFTYYDSYWVQVAANNNIPVTVASASPTSAESGMLWFDTSANKLNVYNVSKWSEASGKEHNIPFVRTGALDIVTGEGAFFFPVDCYLIGVSGGVVTSGTGDTIIDVNKNGTTVFTNQANRLKILSGQNFAPEIIPDVTAFSAGDHMTVDIDAYGAGTSGLTVTVRYREAVT